MVLISTRILMAEQVSKRQLLPTSVSRGWAPIALPSWKSLQDQLVGLTYFIHHCSFSTYNHAKYLVATNIY